MTTAVISQAQAKLFAKGWETAKSRLLHLRESGEKIHRATVQVAETGLTAGALGVANGMWGGKDGEVRLLGVPLDMLLGGLVGFTVIAGGFGAHTEHGVNIVAGSLASMAGRWGQQMGAGWAQQHQGQQQLPGGAQPGAFNGAPAGAGAAFAFNGQAVHQ